MTAPANEGAAKAITPRNVVAEAATHGDLEPLRQRIMAAFSGVWVCVHTNRGKQTRMTVDNAFGGELDDDTMLKVLLMAEEYREARGDQGTVS